MSSHTAKADHLVPSEYESHRKVSWQTTPKNFEIKNAVKQACFLASALSKYFLMFFCTTS
jgi:hypothetical protein